MIEAELGRVTKRPVAVVEEQPVGRRQPVRAVHLSPDEQVRRAVAVRIEERHPTGPPEGVHQARGHRVRDEAASGPLELQLVPLDADAVRRAHPAEEIRPPVAVHVGRRAPMAVGTPEVVGVDSREPAVAIVEVQAGRVTVASDEQVGPAVPVHVRGDCRPRLGGLRDARGGGAVGRARDEHGGRRCGSG